MKNVTILDREFELFIPYEIYISIDRVKDNALQLNQHYTDEIKRVIFHGALHLCGYKDKKPNDIKIMRRAEDFYMLKYQET